MIEPDLHRLIELPFGAAHEELCRTGHPTEVPRFDGEIEYHVEVATACGRRTAWVSVIADSLAAAKKQAQHVAFAMELVPLAIGVDESEYLKVRRVRAFD